MTTYYTPMVDPAQVDTYRRFPIDDFDKLRMSYFKYTAAVALVDGDQIELLDLPVGRVRLLPSKCDLNWSAFGASRTMDIGMRAYYNLSTPSTSPPIAENLTGLVSARDVSAAATAGGVKLDTADGIKLDFYSRGGIRLVATIHGIMPAAAFIEGVVVYAVE